jgi:hypothetical protein
VPQVAEHAVKAPHAERVQSAEKAGAARSARLRSTRAKVLGMAEEERKRKDQKEGGKPKEACSKNNANTQRVT